MPLENQLRKLSDALRRNAELRTLIGQPRMPHSNDNAFGFSDVSALAGEIHDLAEPDRRERPLPALFDARVRSAPAASRRPTFYEFFAGGGMARAGLGNDWNCVFANDFNPEKGVSYRENWGDGGELVIGDIRNINRAALPGTADLVWASFPCQDLSSAGAGAGLNGEKSGTFFPFWSLMDELVGVKRAPKVIVLENVCGMLTSRKGEDFRTVCDIFSKAGYRYGALVIDAELFLPQSRPRLFMIGVRHDVTLPTMLTAAGPVSRFHTSALRKALARLGDRARQDWIWWNLPVPPVRTIALADVLEDDSDKMSWHTIEQTAALLQTMSALNLAKVEAAKKSGGRIIGTIYKRTRSIGAAKAVQAEVRFDGVAGCLRTPGGGSSRQIILVIDGPYVRSRLISARETARLMGLPDTYQLPQRYSDACHLTGDGVVVPVVRHLAHHILKPLCASSMDVGANEFLEAA